MPVASDNKRVAVIGSGLIGRAWAIVFAGAAPFRYRRVTRRQPPRASSSWQHSSPAVAPANTIVIKFFRAAGFARSSMPAR